MGNFIQKTGQMIGKPIRRFKFPLFDFVNIDKTRRPIRKGSQKRAEPARTAPAARLLCTAQVRGKPISELSGNNFESQKREIRLPANRCRIPNEGIGKTRAALSAEFPASFRIGGKF